ncbi:unnamed protein product [Orchesella dallaii]|uniref:Uncharacterized protein n=1 Tax=Orchesella dallaii TaxID=48710 RepID=A0ABP1RRH2_9HEXA
MVNVGSQRKEETSEHEDAELPVPGQDAIANSDAASSNSGEPKQSFKMTTNFQPASPSKSGQNADDFQRQIASSNVRSPSTATLPRNVLQVSCLLRRMNGQDDGEAHETPPFQLSNTNVQVPNSYLYNKSKLLAGDQHALHCDESPKDDMRSGVTDVEETKSLQDLSLPQIHDEGAAEGNILHHEENQDDDAFVSCHDSASQQQVLTPDASTQLPNIDAKLLTSREVALSVPQNKDEEVGEDKELSQIIATCPSEDPDNPFITDWDSDTSERLTPPTILLSVNCRKRKGRTESSKCSRYPSPENRRRRRGAPLDRPSQSRSVHSCRRSPRYGSNISPPRGKARHQVRGALSQHTLSSHPASSSSSLSKCQQGDDAAPSFFASQDNDIGWNELQFDKTKPFKRKYTSRSRDDYEPELNLESKKVRVSTSDTNTGVYVNDKLVQPVLEPSRGGDIALNEAGPKCPGSIKIEPEEGKIIEGLKTGGDEVEQPSSPDLDPLPVARVEDHNNIDSPFSRIATRPVRKIFKVIFYWAVIPGSARRGSFANRSINKLENVKCRRHEDREARKNPKSTPVGECFAQVPLELSLAQTSSRDEESEWLGCRQNVDWLSNPKYNKSANGNR